MISEITMDGEVLDENDYGLIYDGYGIIFHPEFLEKHCNKPYIELIIKTEANLWHVIRIIFLNHA